MSTTFQAGLFCGLAVILAMIGLKLAKVVLKIALIAVAAVVLLLAADSAGWLPDGVVPDLSPASVGPGSDHALTEPVQQVNCASRSSIRARWEGLLRNPSCQTYAHRRCVTFFRSADAPHPDGRQARRSLPP